mmetsp:Transcript_12059/g.33978  ORF Transcript_12059/g.33978 Transcript_12059/m.33978 type:complete len:970 (-) Transcript_12059:542-3451(-)
MSKSGKDDEVQTPPLKPKRENSFVQSKPKEIRKQISENLPSPESELVKEKKKGKGEKQSEEEVAKGDGKGNVFRPKFRKDQEFGLSETFAVAVCVQSASGIKSITKHGSNAYASVSSFTSLGSVRWRSQVIPATTSPRWDSNYLIPRAEVGDYILAEIVHTPKKGFLGSVKVVFSKDVVKAAATNPERKVDLQLPLGVAVGTNHYKDTSDITGTLCISLQFLPIPDNCDASQTPRDKQGEARSIFAPSKELPATLDVIILQADYLFNPKKKKAADSDKDRLEAKADSRALLADGLVHCNPFCILRHGNQVYYTQKKEETCFPVWNEDCTFVIDDVKGCAPEADDSDDEDTSVDNIRYSQDFSSSESSKKNGSLSESQLLSFHDHAHGEKGSSGFKSTDSFAYVSENRSRFMTIEVYSADGDEKGSCIGLGSMAIKELAHQDPKNLVITLTSPPEVFEETGSMYAGTLHLRTQFCYTPERKKNALLASYGWPLRTLPCRVDTGDIVLFYNTNRSVFSLTIKFFSKSKWSHCGMVVRKPDNSLWIAEATQSSAVQLFPLEWRMANRFNRYHTISIRHLVVSRTPEMLYPLYSFLDIVQGRSYEKDVRKMFASLLGVGAKTFQAYRDQTMTCSEYIAACYQIMGLLHPKAHMSACIIPAFFAMKEVPLRHPPSSPSPSATLDKLILFRCAGHPMPLVSNKSPVVPWVDIFYGWDGTNGWDGQNPDTEKARQEKDVVILFTGKNRSLCRDMYATSALKQPFAKIAPKIDDLLRFWKDEVYLHNYAFRCQLCDLGGDEGIHWMAKMLEKWKESESSESVSLDKPTPPRIGSVRDTFPFSIDDCDATAVVCCFDPASESIEDDVQEVLDVLKPVANTMPVILCAVHLKGSKSNPLATRRAQEVSKSWEGRSVLVVEVFLETFRGFGTLARAGLSLMTGLSSPTDRVSSDKELPRKIGSASKHEKSKKNPDHCTVS